MINIVAIIGVVISLISIVLFVLNGLYFQDRLKALNATSSEKSRVNTLMIINYVFAGLMGLALIYFIYASFKVTEVVETKTTARPVPQQMLGVIPNQTTMVEREEYQEEYMSLPRQEQSRGQALVNMQQYRANAMPQSQYTNGPCPPRQIVYASPACDRNQLLYGNPSRA